MEKRQRLVVGAIWIVVAALMVIAIEPGVPTSLADGLRLFVIVLALFLAVVYLFDPKGVISKKFEF